MRDTKSEVILYKCRAHFPFWFAVHTWFVCNNKRYEVLYKANKYKLTYGFIYVKESNLKLGLRCFSFVKKPKWKSLVIKNYSEKESKILQSVLENSVDKYPYKNQYKLIGPNSNTYTAWVLKQAGLSTKDLPTNAFGKNFKI